MKRSPGSSRIAVATSIPPKLTRMNLGQSIGEEYQKLCIRSWIDCGFRILSVNDREEIPNLAAKYPEVLFIAADRNASAWTERKTPHIADLLLALNDAPEPVLGIINSDIVFEPAPSWQECLPSLVGENLIVGHRYDTASLLQGALRRLEYGIDYFFFDKALIGDALRHAMPFAMGLPSWDYWLCLAAAFDGRRLMQIDQLKVVHLDHDRAWSNENWNKFGQFLARFVIAECERVTRDLPECITAIEPACRAVAALPDEELAGNKAFHPRIREMAIIFNQWYPESVTRFESGTPSIFDGKTSSYDAAFDCPEALTPLNTFGRFESRVAAGHALSKAKYLLRAGNLEGAERELSAAVKETPDDFGVLLALGEVTFRSGNFQGAHIYLSKAAEQRPNSPVLLLWLGRSLRALHRREEAIESFQRILLIDRQYKSVYPDLANVLSEANRQSEALACLESALALWPDFPRATELYDRLSAMKNVAPPSLGMFQRMAGALARLR